MSDELPKPRALADLSMDEGGYVTTCRDVVSGYGLTALYDEAQMRAFRAAGVAQAIEACAKLCEARYMGDNTRGDMEARACAAAIRATIPQDAQRQQRRTDLHDSGLDCRTANVLKGAGVETLEQALAMGDLELLRINGFGRASLKYLRALRATIPRTDQERADYRGQDNAR